MNKMRKMIDFLISNANPSIVYRVKKEILNKISLDEEKQFQDAIISEEIIQSIVHSQKDNGWIGNGFHGPNKNAGRYENQETGIKYMAEKGVQKNFSTMKKAMEAFVNIPLTDPCYRTKGKLYDEFKYAANGQNLIRCACIARAGYSDIINIEPQIQLSIDSFKRVLEVDSILDVSRSIKSSKHRLFNNYEKWPCRYHLDILAHTNSWQNEENCLIIADAVHKMMRTDSPELIGLTAASWVGHVLGTVGCFPSQGFSLIDFSNSSPRYRLEYILWLARCGVVKYSPILQEIVNTLLDSVNDDGISNIDVDDDMFRNWGPYAGLQLETDWKTKIKRDCDITFRVLQICYYSGIEIDE